MSWTDCTVSCERAMNRKVSIDRSLLRAPAVAEPESSLVCSRVVLISARTVTL
ncbi:hypothetical protein D3C72_2122560 [compost metagenome]